MLIYPIDNELKEFAKANYNQPYSSLFENDLNLFLLLKRDITRKNVNIPLVINKIIILQNTFNFKSVYRIMSSISDDELYLKRMITILFCLDLISEFDLPYKYPLDNNLFKKVSCYVNAKYK